MTQEYKKKLYEYFYKDTPISYESITDAQWEATSKTLAGFSIQLNLALGGIAKEVSKILVGIEDSLSKIFKGRG